MFVYYPVFAYAAEHVLAPVTAFPVGSDCVLLAKTAGRGRRGEGERVVSAWSRGEGGKLRTEIGVKEETEGAYAWKSRQRGFLREKTYTVYKASSAPILVAVIETSSEQGPDCNTLHISPLRTRVAPDFLLVLPDHTEVVLLLPLSRPDSDRMVSVRLSLPRNSGY